MKQKQKQKQQNNFLQVHFQQMKKKKQVKDPLK